MCLSPLLLTVAYSLQALTISLPPFSSFFRPNHYSASSILAPSSYLDPCRSSFPFYFVRSVFSSLLLHISLLFFLLPSYLPFTFQISFVISSYSSLLTVIEVFQIFGCFCKGSTLSAKQSLPNGRRLVSSWQQCQQLKYLKLKKHGDTCIALQSKKWEYTAGKISEQSVQTSIEPVKRTLRPWHNGTLSNENSSQ